MNESKISVRYAKAFFSAAIEKKLIDAVRKDVDLLLQILQTQPKVKEVLASPVIKTGEKIRLVDKGFSGMFNELTINFLRLLLHNNREMYLTEICLNFRTFHSNYTGIRNAELLTAVPVDEEQLQMFNELIQQHFGGKAEIQLRVDEKLLGGFILRVEDRQYDASVATQLKKLRRELVNVITN